MRYNRHRNILPYQGQETGSNLCKDVRYRQHKSVQKSMSETPHRNKKSR